MDGLYLAIIGIASAVIFSGIGSAIGLFYSGAACAGVMTEDPKNFGKYLMLFALPGTQGIYGFAIAFLMMLKLKIIGGPIPSLTVSQGLNILFACLPVAFAGLGSGINQGKVCASGIYLTLRQPNEVGKALVLGVFVELYAVLGLLISFFMWMGLKI
ncbi:MAG: V-type ATP synthase subunit K [bacterium]